MLFQLPSWITSMVSNSVFFLWDREQFPLLSHRINTLIGPAVFHSPQAICQASCQQSKQSINQYPALMTSGVPYLGMESYSGTGTWFIQTFPSILDQCWESHGAMKIRWDDTAVLKKAPLYYSEWAQGKPVMTEKRTVHQNMVMSSNLTISQTKGLSTSPPSSHEMAHSIFKPAHLCVSVMGLRSRRMKELGEKKKTSEAELSCLTH